VAYVARLVIGFVTLARPDFDGSLRHLRTLPMRAPCYRKHVSHSPNIKDYIANIELRISFNVIVAVEYELIVLTRV